MQDEGLKRVDRAQRRHENSRAPEQGKDNEKEGLRPICAVEAEAWRSSSGMPARPASQIIAKNGIIVQLLTT